MKFFKLLFFLGFITLVACKKDTTTAACEPPVFSKNIVGAWSLSAVALGQTAKGSATFNADGTLKDDNDFLISGSINGVKLTEKSWKVSADEKSLITTVSSKPNGGGSYFNSTYDFKSQTCTSIELSLSGFATLSLSK